MTSEDDGTDDYRTGEPRAGAAQRPGGIRVRLNLRWTRSWWRG